MTALFKMLARFVSWLREKLFGDSTSAEAATTNQKAIGNSKQFSQAISAPNATVTAIQAETVNAPVTVNVLHQHRDDIAKPTAPVVKLEDIVDALKKVTPYQRSIIGDLYKGQFIDEAGEYSSSYPDGTNEFVTISVHISAKGLWVRGKFHLSKYPELRTLPESSPVRIRGKLCTISSPSFEVEDAELIQLPSSKLLPSENGDPLREQRQFVSDDLISIRDSFAGMTSCQITEIAKNQYLGKWMEADWIFHDLLHNSDDFQVLLYPKDARNGYSGAISASFNRSWEPMLRTLQPGATIRVRGAIQEMSKYELNLRDCELIDSRLEKPRRIMRDRGTIVTIVRKMMSNKDPAHALRTAFLENRSAGATETPWLLEKTGESTVQSCDSFYAVFCDLESNRRWSAPLDRITVDYDTEKSRTRLIIDER